MKCVLITGAGKGIGFSCVERMAKNKNTKVIAVSRTKQDLIPFAKFKNVFTFVGDVNSSITVKRIFDFAKRKKIIINKLVNNAGVRQRKSFLKISNKEIYDVFKTNFFSPFNIMQIFSKNLIKNKESGTIVNIGSIVGTYAFQELSGYASTKMALIGLTKSFAAEMSKFGIRANVVSPGFTKTSFYENFKKKKELYKWTIEKKSLKRWGNSDEVAELVEYLLSEKSSFINGENIKIDGGWNNA